MNCVIEMLRPVPTRASERGVFIDRDTLSGLLKLLASLVENKSFDPEQDELMCMTLMRLSLVLCELLQQR